MKSAAHVLVLLTLPFVIAAGCTGEPIADPTEPTYDELLSEGTSMAEVLCQGCHAIGAQGDSPHPNAPAFRDLSKQIDLESLREPFAQGFVANHPDMPEWQFEPRHIDALITYLESVQSPD